MQHFSWRHTVVSLCALHSYALSMAQVNTEFMAWHECSRGCTITAFAVTGIFGAPVNQPIIVLCVVLALAGLIGLAFYFFRHHQGVKATLKGPGGTAVTVEAQTKPGSATVEDVKSGGKILASSQIDGDARVSKSEAASNVTARVSSGSGNQAPKA
jgi:hypothetical protein